MASIPLLQLSRNNSVYDHYEVNKFYKIPVLALDIIKNCQQLSRSRLLQREEIINILKIHRLKIELRSRFQQWRRLSCVNCLLRKHLKRHCFFQWHSAYAQKKLIGKFRRVYRLREAKYWSAWFITFKTSLFKKRKEKLILQNTFAGFRNYLAKLKRYNQYKVISIVHLL